MFVAEFWEDIRIIFPAIVEHLHDSDHDIHSAAIELLSELAAQGVC